LPLHHLLHSEWRYVTRNAGELEREGVASGATGQQRMRLWSEEYRRQDFGAEIPRALQSSAQNKQRKSRKRFHGGLLIPAQRLIIGNRG
jgi:hypothetical protein